MADMVFNKMSVQAIPSGMARAFICKHHYSKTCHANPAYSYALIYAADIVGVICFARSCSENGQAALFGWKYRNRVIELHRLFVLDTFRGMTVPKNTESWFISRALKMLKQACPHLWAVRSFADPTEGHEGIIYKATNFTKVSVSGKATFYRDSENRLRHPRQNGVNICSSEASRRGWVEEKREGKIQYVRLLPDKKGHLNKLKDMARYYIG